MPDIVSLIETVGYFGIFSIIFIETGFFFGFLLPGDTLIFTAGFLAAQKFLNLPFLIIIVATAAISGYFTGYAFGLKIGPKIFAKENSLFFNKKYLQKTHLFFEKYGQLTVLFARFIPIIRTFASILAGVGRMRWSLFVFYNISGGLIWTTTITLLGYWVGRVFSYFHPKIVSLIFLVFITIILILSWLPLFFRWLKNKKNSHARLQ